MSDGLNLTIKSHGKDQSFTIFTPEGEVKVSLRHCDARSASLNVLGPIKWPVLRESLIAQRDDTKTVTSRELLREACELLEGLSAFCKGGTDLSSEIAFLAKVKDLL
jgi:hypothetical protein